MSLCLVTGWCHILCLKTATVRLHFVWPQPTVMFQLGGGRAGSVCCHGFGWLLGLLSCFSWVVVGLAVFAAMGLAGCWACCHVSAGWWSGCQCLLSWVWLAAWFTVMFQLGDGRAVSVCCHVSAGWWSGSQCLLSWVWLAAGFAVMFQLGSGRAVSVCCHGFGWLLGLLSWFSWVVVRLLVFAVMGLAGCWACCHISAGLWQGGNWQSLPSWFGWLLLFCDTKIV